MRTEPTEALKEIKRCTWTAEDFNISNGFEIHEVVDKNDAINIVNIAFREGQSSTKIKQLEWKETDYYIEARTKIGKYLTMSSDTSINSESRVQMYFGGTGEIVFDGTLDEAKAAAQADFEQRVKECLEFKNEQKNEK